MTQNTKEPGWHNTIPPEPMNDEEKAEYYRSVRQRSVSRLWNRRIFISVMNDNSVLIVTRKLVDRKERKIYETSMFLSEEAARSIIECTMGLWFKNRAKPWNGQ